MTRAHSAGPAVLPLEVIEELQRCPITTTLDLG